MVRNSELETNPIPTGHSLSSPQYSAKSLCIPRNRSSPPSPVFVSLALSLESRLPASPVFHHWQATPHAPPLASTTSKPHNPSPFTDGACSFPVSLCATLLLSSTTPPLTSSLLPPSGCTTPVHSPARSAPSRSLSAGGTHRAPLRCSPPVLRRTAHHLLSAATFLHSGPRFSPTPVTTGEGAGASRQRVEPVKTVTRSQRHREVRQPRPDDIYLYA